MKRRKITEILRMFKRLFSYLITQCVGYNCIRVLSKHLDDMTQNIKAKEKYIFLD